MLSRHEESKTKKANASIENKRPWYESDSGILPVIKGRVKAEYILPELTKEEWEEDCKNGLQRSLSEGQLVWY